MKKSLGPESSKIDHNRADAEEHPHFPGKATDIRTLALTGIFILISLFTLYLGRDVFLPVIMAMLLSWLLGPIVRALRRAHIPEPVGAGLVMMILLGTAVGGIYGLSGPAGAWLEKAPSNLEKVRQELQSLLKPVANVQETTNEIKQIVTLQNVGNAPAVEVRNPKLSAIVLSEMQLFFFRAGVTTILLFFLLASGDLFLLKLVKVLPTLGDKKRAVEICREIGEDISIYLSMVTLVNAGLGTAIGLAMFFIGLPNPVLWGVMAAFLNYIPYLGALTGIIIVTIAGILTFNHLAPILLIPCVYLFLNVLEAYFVTPTLLGRRLALNPVIIFVWLIVWGWIWGIVGAILAVPLLAVIKIISDHFRTLAALSEFLSAEARSLSL